MINIYKNYYIDADDNNFMLKRKSINKKKATGEEYDAFKVLGYFTSMNSLYSYFVREVEKEVIMDETVTNLREFIEAMNDVIVELKYFTRRLEDIDALRDASKGGEE